VKGLRFHAHAEYNFLALARAFPEPKVQAAAARSRRPPDIREVVRVPVDEEGQEIETHPCSRSRASTRDL